jgi:SAM-dependent methyltransferase
LDLHLCRDCGHVQLPHVVDPALLFRDYYYRTATSLGLVEHFRRYAREVVEWLRPPPDGLVVEVGSNDGSFLAAFRERGLRVLGVDPAAAIAAEATARGLPTLPDFFSYDLARRIRREHGPASIVAANNVYAHIDDMDGITRGIREILAGDGVFVFEVSWLVDTIEKRLIDTIYHEHLSYHALRPLERFLGRHGLALVRVERVPTKGGSIRCYVQRVEGARPRDRGVDALIEIEAAAGVDDIQTFRALQGALEGMKRTLRDLLEGCRREGGVTAGYGISVTVTTLLHFFDLGDLIDFVVDDNPAKHGMYTPGHHLPVLAPAALYERGARLAVIFAWFYADAVMKRHADFLARGGRFVIPLPEIRVRPE